MTFTPLTPRPRAVLHDFAQALEETLVRNDYKPDWRALDGQALLDLLREEFAELETEIRKVQDDPGLDNDLRIGFEALDLAVAAMFVWDKARGPAASENRGRA
jgi:hypothetical protein